MAGDWIKWVKGLTRRPEIVRVSSALGLDRRRTSCAAMELWEWADDVTVDGTVIGVTPAFVDDLVQIQGFFAALASVGWISEVSGGIRFTNFTRHNGESAKRRAIDNARKAEARSNVRKVSEKCPDETRTKLGPEKRREEKRRQEEEEEPRCGPAAPPAELRQWAAEQAKRPDWLPTGKPWITASVWLKLGQAVKASGTVTLDDYAAIVREARDSRHTLSNPAAFIVARLKALTKGTQ